MNNIEDLQINQNDAPDLPNLPPQRYENIFKLGKNNGYYFFNILKSVKFPEDLSTDIFYYKTVETKMPHTALSYKIYGTQNLWWFLLLSNNIINPVKYLTPGTRIKVIKKEYIKDIIDQIKKLSNA